MMRVTRREFFGAAAVSAAAGARPVDILVPPGGGTPRDPKRIVRLGPHEFRIHAAVEEGRSPLTHAVSRVDVIVRNPGDQAEVTLHLDLSGDGTRTNLDTNQFGGMPDRDFIYLQPPGGLWRRMDGKTSGWVATVTFAAPPGETKIGLGPWYTYADYLSYIGSLPSHPHLNKETIGTSDAGREHWELTITDPSAPVAGKRRILWHAREHGYETFSSFAIEGAVDYLLSPAAAEARRRFVFTLHPMTNVDGVAQGHEYRVGYDYPEPRGSATGRLTFGAADRLRPDFFITWHNWTAPRDFDVVFYTDSEADKPSRRVWDLLTQHLPSPRGVGHRYESETNPLRHNFFGRKLSEDNVHQYSMLRYGTRVFGWEMPWWGREEGDPARNARLLGFEYARAFLAAIDSKWMPPAEAPAIDAARWQVHEFVLHGRAHVDNPFRDAALVGEFVSPSGQMLVVEGFHDGEDTWRLRFAPPEEGEWRYLLRGEGVALYEHGRMQVKQSGGHGFIGIHPGNPYAFAYSDGTPFFPMGDTCYGLFDDTPITPALRIEYLETRRQQKFNFVRMSIGHSPYRAAADPAYWAWGGTAQQPDLDRFNPVFFQAFDRLLLDMRSRGMNSELLLFNYYRKPFTDPAQWTSARERQWLRYVVARYAAFDNVFLWTLSNEYETHPDGKYRLDLPGDVEWAKAIGRLVKHLDPYRHPFTVHPVISSNAQGETPRSSFEPPWRIGGFFGEGKEVDVLSQQTSLAYGGRWDEALQVWMGDPAGVEASIAADRNYRKPVLNTENGYEYLPGHATNRRQVHHTDRVRRAAWRIVCAGGYFAAGFIGTVGHSDHWDRIEPANKHPFLVKDAGVAEQLAHLYGFFRDLPFWRMEPRQDMLRGAGVCLAAPGEIYAVYAPNGGKLGIDLGAPKNTLTARWFNPREGDFREPAAVPGGRWQEFQGPDSQDWVLLIR